ncbi:MAG: hypothetical protein RQ745_12060 [Longimicrobiales bacterium]|nr:hypothetical protein [Longimicrobiales bacterium]
MTRSLLPLLLLLLAAACDVNDNIAPADVEAVSNFDNGLGEWTPLNLNLAPGTGFAVEAMLGRAVVDLNATDSGGVGGIVREFLVPAGAEYRVELDFIAESSDGPENPWTIVVGTSVDDGPFDLVDAFSTATAIAGEPRSLPLFGDLFVMGGAGGTGDAGVRIVIGFRPETAGNRMYALDNILVRFIEL